MVECAKRHCHNPEAWLTDVLERLPAKTNQEDLSVLMPSNWQPVAAGTAPLRETCPGVKQRTSSKPYIPVYATYAPAARTIRRPSVEPLHSGSVKLL